MLRADFKDGEVVFYTGTRTDVSACVRYKYHMRARGMTPYFYTWSTSEEVALRTAKKNVRAYHKSRPAAITMALDTIEVVEAVPHKLGD